ACTGPVGWSTPGEPVFSLPLPAGEGTGYVLPPVETAATVLPPEDSSSMTAPAPKSPRRRCFTLSLRALMILVLVTGAWLGWRVKRAETQKWAVAAIEKLGGDVSYDDNSPSGQQGFFNQRWAPAWLRRQVGDEYFQEVVEVDFYNTSLSDADLVA